MSSNPGNQILAFLSQQPDRSAKPSEIMTALGLGTFRTATTLAMLERQGLNTQGENSIYTLAAEWEHDPSIPPEVTTAAVRTAQLVNAHQAAGFTRDEAIQIVIATIRANNHTTTHLA